MYGAQEIDGCCPHSRVSGCECLLDKVNMWLNIEPGNKKRDDKKLESEVAGDGSAASLCLHEAKFFDSSS